MTTVQTLANNLHQLQADAKSVFGEDDHTAYVQNGEVMLCENCNGGLPKTRYCWQYHLMKLAVSPNGPAYYKEHV